MTIDPHSNILITGGTGMVGRNLAAYLRHAGFDRVHALSRSDCDLMDYINTTSLFADLKPDYVFHLAGRVRGLGGNMRAQGDAYLQNALINTHVVEAAHLAKVKKIVAMGTVAMYPDMHYPGALCEDHLWFGKPHDSELGYAQAKRGMLAHLEAYHNNYGTHYAVALSTNLYGPHDRFNASTGHVIPSLIAKFYYAAQTGGVVGVWGDGSAQRDFLHVKDCVRALVLIMEKAEGVINLATGTSYKIHDVVSILCKYTGFSAVYDAAMPNGQLARSYDVSRLAALGFHAQVSLEDGLRETYDWYTNTVG